MKLCLSGYFPIKQEAWKSNKEVKKKENIALCHLSRANKELDLLVSDFSR